MFWALLPAIVALARALDACSHRAGIEYMRRITLPFWRGVERRLCYDDSRCAVSIRTAHVVLRCVSPFASNAMESLGASADGAVSHRVEVTLADVETVASLEKVKSVRPLTCDS